MRTRTRIRGSVPLCNGVLVGLSGTFLACLYAGFSQTSQAESIYDQVMRSERAKQQKNSTSTSVGTNTAITGGATKASPYPSSGQEQSPYPSSGQEQSPYPSSGQAQSPYPSSGQAQSPYPSSGQAQSPYPSSGQAQSPYPSSGQAQSPYPSSGQEQSPYPSSVPGESAVGGQAPSKVQNAVNRGIQSGLQRGLNHGANAIDRLGRKFGIQGLGSSLSAPNGLAVPNGPPIPSGGQQYSSSAGSQASGTEESSFRRHVTPSIPQGGGAGGDDGRAAWEAAGKRARESQNAAYLTSAQNAEARGDWMQAAFAYNQAMGDTIRTEDDEAGRRNKTGSNDEMIKRQARDPMYKTLTMKSAYCWTQMINQIYSGQVRDVDAKHTEGQLQHCYQYLKLRDPGNAAWHYLDAVFYCSDNRTKDWHYIFAWNRLVDALKSPRLTPSIKAKCLALQAHIKPAKELQQNDMKRAVFSMEQDLVWNVEHPHIAGTEHRESRVRLDETHDLVTTYSRDYMNTELWAVETYDDCKKDLAQNFPTFKTRWLKQLNDMMAMPNQGVAVPSGPPNEEPAIYCPPRWEALAFGPLDLTIGRQYPNGGPGTGHYDPDLLPRGYIQAMNRKVKGK
jgi:hypothetical protein